MMETIELVYRPVDAITTGISGAVHGFLLYTRADGSKEMLSGKPETEGFPFNGQLEAVIENPASDCPPSAPLSQI